jgi:hypothetical protein
VVGGAFVAAALSLILLALGAGLGLSSISPWSTSHAASGALRAATILWLIGMQAAAFGMGGYLSGRLRTKWVNVHSDEVFFRDTAHGFLAWAVSVAITASLLTGAATSLVSGGAELAVTTMAAAGKTADPATSDPTAYFVDALFRSDRPSAAPTDPATRAEIGRILALSLPKGDLPAGDRTYVATVVAAHTGISQADAEQRVATVSADAKHRVREAETAAREAADEARRAAAHLSLWLFVALLVGAFTATYAATIGGRQRDHWPATR